MDRLSPDISREVSRRVFLRAAAGLGLAAFVGCSRENRDTKRTAGDISIERKEVITEADLLAYDWRMAGVRQHAGKLELSPVNLAVGRIMNDENENQTRLTYAPNIPMNAYGPRLETAGDFELKTTFSLEENAKFTFQLCGELPLEFDDFLLMRKGTRFTFEQGKVLVEVWDGTHQESQTYQHNLPLELQKTISVSREKDMLTVSDETGPLFAVPEAGNYLSQGVWLGIAVANADCQLTHLSARPLSGDKLEIVDTSTLRVSEPADSLAKQAKTRVGTAVSLHPLVEDPNYAAAIREFDILTTENALKPRNTQPREGVFTFEAGDALVDFATRHGQEIWGHTTVWYKELPQWMNELPTETEADKERVKQVMINHITEVVSHYKGKIKSWDIVNEILAHDSTDLRENLWYQAMGANYIETALRAARGADPGAEFWINEYALDKDAQKDEDRFQSILELAIPLQKQGLLHGVAFQGHVYEIPRDTMSPDAIERRVKQLREHGLDARISEMDVTVANGIDEQTDQFESVAVVCADLGIDFSVWGVGGPYVSTAGLDENGFSFGSNLLFDNELEPRPAYSAVKRALAKS